MNDQTELFAHEHAGIVLDDAKYLLASHSVLKHEAGLIKSLQLGSEVSLQLVLQPIQVEPQDTETVPARGVGMYPAQYKIARKGKTFRGLGIRGLDSHSKRPNHIAEIVIAFGQVTSSDALSKIKNLGLEFSPQTVADFLR